MPAKISTNSEAEMLKKGTPASEKVRTRGFMIGFFRVHLQELFIVKIAII